MRTGAFGRWLLTAALTLTTQGPVSAQSEHSKPEGPPTADSAGAESREISDHYVHRWIPMPSFTAQGLGQDAGPMAVAPRAGRMLVLVFIASYCEPCQQQMEDLLRLEKKYRRLNADFVYVFAHDTKADAEGYMKEFGMTHGVLANFDVLKAYHNPKLPTIYVGDRRGWLMTRYEDIKTGDIARLEAIMRNLTAF